jgi:hypothetical protein
LKLHEQLTPTIILICVAPLSSHLLYLIDEINELTVASEFLLVCEID